MTPDSPRFSILTFNLLAPPYKRLPARGAHDARERERDHDALWTARIDAIIRTLQALSPAPTVIALQEVWFHKPLLAKLEAAFAPYYHMFYARRPHKEDGLATLVSRSAGVLRDVSHVSTFLLSDASVKGACDRIGLAVSAELVAPRGGSTPTTRSRLLVVNTHLTFPHSFIPGKMREMQANVLTSFINSYCKASAQPVASVLLGDFNSDLRSSVCQSVLQQRFVSCYQQLHGDGSSPVTHLNHRRQHVFVDHVFLRHGRGTERTSPSPVSVVRDGGSGGGGGGGGGGGAEARARKTGCALVARAATVHPHELPTGSFPAEFKLSDHRPVSVAFERVVVPVWR